MSRKIRIIHVVPAFSYGIASYVKGLLNGEDCSKIQCDIVGFGEVPGEFEILAKSKGGLCYQLPSAHSAPRDMLVKLCTIINKGEYDVMHCHVYGYRGSVFKFLARLFGIKHVIIHAHASDEENKTKLFVVQKKINTICNLAFANHYFTCSKIAAEYQFGKKFCDKHKVITMPNSVDTDRFCDEMCEEEKLEYFKELQINNEQLILIHVGRFYNQKNHTFLIDILYDVKRHDSNVVLLMVGTGVLQDSIMRMVNQKGLQENVRFLNERNDVDKLLQIADIFVLPSFFEGLPVVGIEAQAAGIPLIASDTITSEVDMGLNLVDFLPINEGTDVWKRTILDKGKNKRKLIKGKRINALENKGFTIVGLWNKYYSEISQY